MTPPTRAASARRSFVRASTRLRQPPYVPELRLHLADDVTALWQRMESDLGRPGLDPPFWATAWGGGLAVARYLLDHPQEVAGRSVLDLASGSGLCAIAAALAGAEPVTAVDVDVFSEAAVRENAAVNGVAVRPVVGDLLDAEPWDVDVVLAGDVCYERRLAERVLVWLSACREGGTRVLLGDIGRAFLPREALVEVARFDMAGDPALERAGTRQASVFTLV